MTTTAAQRVKEAMKVGRVYRTKELRHFSNNLARDLEKLVDSLRPQIEAAHRRPTKEEMKGLFDALTL